jgi:hypothetical protein
MEGTYLGHSHAPLGKRSENMTVGREAMFGAAIQRKMKVRKGMHPK